MEKYHNLSRMDYKQWFEKILGFYWLMVIISVLGQCIGLFVTFLNYPDWISEFLVYKIILPTSVQLLIMLGCVYFIKVKKIYSSRFLTISGTLVALVIILTHPDVPGLQVMLLLPMSVALIYFDKSKLLFSFIVNMVALSVIYIFPAIRESVSEYEFFSYLLSLFAGYFIYLAILERGNEVLQIVKKASEKEKELLVKSTMMERLTKIDALTNLYNHKTFQEYLDQFVEQSLKYEMPLQLAILDIDNFKTINDTYGHSVGDLVLKRLANAIVDKVTENDIVARYGGEEFALLLTNKSLEETYQLIEDIRLHISQINHEEMKAVKVTVSIGLKDFNAGLSKLHFFKQADALLYKAKRNGKNQVMFEN
ncbi:GGDEF domain-containing protein [Metabacillus litoralis]|uniref:GGDEF domain-containing protein n=1 Tax=Metabacillus litoralis TaxID=152268 RepID=A0A5C6VZA5_9BACI|nr:GGDEF domain-containing protein [Metabacillus litoralis]TXC90428.1 GGDEF domain-containing protein [Metabacillus litoralis]